VKDFLVKKYAEKGQQFLAVFLWLHRLEFLWL